MPMYFWFGRFRASIARKQDMPATPRDYHAVRHAQEMAMARAARSPAAAHAHAALAEAHRQAMDDPVLSGDRAVRR